MSDGPEAMFDQLHELFGDLFGRTPRDLRQPLVVELAEAAEGAERTVELSRATACRACRGRGGAPGATYVRCAKCEGRGGERRADGFLVFAASCEACGGARGRWSTPCPACDGRRETRRTKKVRVTIPPGVAAGHVLRLAEQGNDLGQGPGDALLTIEIAPHRTLRRDGDDLRARVRLDRDLAERGGEARVPWLGGSARVPVPAGATHGTETRLRGWGCVRFGSAYAPPPAEESPYRSAAPPARGDLVVTFVTRDEAADGDDEPRPPPLDLGDLFAQHARDREDPVARALREHDEAPAADASPQLVAFAFALVVLVAGAVFLLLR